MSCLLDRQEILAKDDNPFKKQDEHLPPEQQTADDNSLKKDGTQIAVGAKRIYPGSRVQNTVLYHMVCMFEGRRRKWLREDPVVTETIMFFNKNNKRAYGIIARVHKSNSINEPTRFDIDIPALGSKSDKVLRYRNVNRNRVERLQKYFSCDSDWMAYAARSTGFEESEIPLRLQLMAREIERIPDTSKVQKSTAYKSSSCPVHFPVVPVSWRRSQTNSCADE